MWQEVLAKISELKGLDRHFRVSGAEQHRYEFAPPATPAEIRGAELAIGCRLPEEISQLYSDLGNGGVGPLYGLRSLVQLTGYQAGCPFTGSAAIRRALPKPGEFWAE